MGCNVGVLGLLQA